MGGARISAKRTLWVEIKLSTKLITKLANSGGVTMRLVVLRILSSATECWQRVQWSSAWVKTPCTCPASNTEVSANTAAAAMSHKRSLWEDWRINVNMGCNLKKFYDRCKCYVITIIKIWIQLAGEVRSHHFQLDDEMP